ncbi:hypothetical protein E5288_WYG004227 [Bos mutus]|uniref:Uncharacterized protein n=1 Tax=Bos mutus TaxID=72004 RepID=A0A6B0R469_9CETA|nr:hypothetical protein [Bos mutus]
MERHSGPLCGAETQIGDGEGTLHGGIREEGRKVTLRNTGTVKDLERQYLVQSTQSPPFLDVAVPRAPGDQVIITVAHAGPWPLLTARRWCQTKPKSKLNQPSHLISREDFIPKASDSKHFHKPREQLCGEKTP